MSRSIVWTRPALGSLSKLDPPVAKQVIRALDRLADTGEGDVSRLRPPLVGMRLRVCDWRVLFDQDEAGGIITGHCVEHRSKAQGAIAGGRCRDAEQAILDERVQPT